MSTRTSVHFHAAASRVTHPAAGHRRLPSTSSCLRNNLQLFFLLFFLAAAVLARGSSRAPHSCAFAVRQIHAGGLAPPWMTRQLNSHTVHTCGHFFCQPSEQSWRARTDEHSPAAASVLALSSKKEGGKDAAPRRVTAQTARTKPERPTLQASSTAPPPRQSVFVLHPVNGIVSASQKHL